MTTTKIGLDDIAAIPNPEGRAVALALYNKLQAAQCWVIVNKETKATFLGRFSPKPMQTTSYGQCLLSMPKITKFNGGKVVRNERILEASVSGCLPRVQRALERMHMQMQVLQGIPV